MIVFFLRIADHIIEIHSRYRYIYNMCENYIENNVDNCPERNNRRLKITIDNNDIENEKIASRHEDWSEGTIKYRYYDDSYLESLIVYRKIANLLLDDDILLMHGSVISTRGQGYMIVANSGMGKTTRTLLWVKSIPDSFVVNGDKPLIKVSDEEVIAYGTPWCGKENMNKNTSVPLKAIFILERADDTEEDSVEELQLSQAITSMYQHTYQQSGTLRIKKTFQLLKGMKGKVKFFRFRSKPTFEAVKLAYKTANDTIL